jgi:Phycobilisome protein
MPLPENIQELIAKARIVSFSKWETTHPASAIQIFQAADDAGKYLTDAELAEIAALAPNNSTLIPIVQSLRDRATEIVDEAREEVLTTFPNITQPGGGLYPAERATACWRDFWHFLRCITYGIAGSHPEYTSEVGLDYMRQLYEELEVPLEAMVIGLKGIKTASLRRCEASGQSAMPLATNEDGIAPYFDHLIAKMSSFQTN